MYAVNFFKTTSIGIYMNIFIGHVIMKNTHLF